MLLTKRGTTVTNDGVIFSQDPTLKDLLYPFSEPESAIKSILFKVQCTVLILRGTERCVKTNVEDEEALLERLKVIYFHAKFKMWKNIHGGHHLHLDNPEKTAQEIKQFLAIQSSLDNDGKL